MTWFKVDDDLPFHRKVVKAGNAAIGLWVRAGAWSSQQLTDGFVPDDMIALMGTPAQRKKLVSARLWIEVDGGCQFHEWSDSGRQPTAQNVRERRSEAAKRQQKYRDNNFRSSQVSDVRNSVTDSAVTEVVTPVLTPAPTRPVPTTTTSPADAAAEAPPTSEAKRRKRTQLPHDWRPSDSHIEYATQNGIDVEHEAGQFRSHAEATGRLMANWNAAFRTWLGNAKQWNPQRGHLRSVPAAPTSLPGDPSAAFNELRERNDAKTAAKLIGTWWPNEVDQPRGDPLPYPEYARRARVAFIDENADAIRAALARRAAG